MGMAGDVSGKAGNETMIDAGERMGALWGLEPASVGTSVVGP